jgi:hypothetical protein
MAKKNTTDHETRLRAAFKTMSGDEYQTIREAYYKAVEGLRTLADALEQVAGSVVMRLIHSWPNT